MPSTTIGGHTYVCEPHPALEGMRVAKRVWAVASPSVGTMVDRLFLAIPRFRAYLETAEYDEKKPDTAVAEILRIAAAAFGDISFRQIGVELVTGLTTFDETLVVDLLKYTTRDGEPLTEEAINQAFRGRYQDFAAVCWWVAENVNGFFPADVSFSTVLSGLGLLDEGDERATG